jgi:hypothetical protein
VWAGYFKVIFIHSRLSHVINSTFSTIFTHQQPEHVGSIIFYHSFCLLHCLITIIHHCRPATNRNQWRYYISKQIPTWDDVIIHIYKRLCSFFVLCKRRLGKLCARQRRILMPMWCGLLGKLKLYWIFSFIFRLKINSLRNHMFFAYVRRHKMKFKGKVQIESRMFLSLSQQCSLIFIYNFYKQRLFFRFSRYTKVSKAPIVTIWPIRNSGRANRKPGK